MTGDYILDEDGYLCMLVSDKAIVIAVPAGKSLGIDNTDVIGREWCKGYYEIMQTLLPSDFELADEGTFILK